VGKIIELFSKKIDCYTTIDELPMDNWFKIHKTNDVLFLLKKRTNVNAKQIELLNVQWNTIYFEFLDAFGIPEKMQEVIMLRKEIFCLETYLFLTADRTINTFIKIKKYELEKTLEADKKETVDTVTSYVSKYMGRRIDLKVETVREFYGHIAMIKEESKHKKVSNG